jgi:hypothetical protein
MIAPRGKFNYDCPEGQVMSYEILRIVMIGYAKFEVGRAIISTMIATRGKL